MPIGLCEVVHRLDRAGQIGQGFGNGNQSSFTLHGLFSHAPRLWAPRALFLGYPPGIQESQRSNVGNNDAEKITEPSREPGSVAKLAFPYHERAPATVS